ncbi:uncharacterized protein PGRI_049150 [Penicillium griseofulvum]|uniref:Uncharacterized protein n=1 Tax=Penicillium patulum TaxID=5078 RepID=A0A135LAT5_PENPA|nr:uncharacterized protein PGRI_049150 [Penicillium griseofulvum]KXG46059.1 hypothetical protein PGRI_049150 [Penicillium griseofulvum]
MPEAAFSWPNPELENWSTEYLNFKQSEALFRPHSPAYTARYPSYNYQQFPSSQFPSTPVPFGTVMSPTPSSYLDPTTMKQSIDNPSPRSVPTPAIGTGPALSPASLYGARCPSPWDEPPVSTPMTETPPSDDTSNGVSYTKMPHRSCRRAVRIKLLGTRTATITEPLNVNGGIVDMGVCSRAKESSCDISRLSMLVHGLTSVLIPGVIMLQVDGRI